MDDTRWTIIDNSGNTIILKQSTYTDHIVGDHADKDAKIRIEAEPCAKCTLQNPRIIAKDLVREGRFQYIGIATVSNDEYDTAVKLKNIVVVVDKNVVPYEVVTWIVQRNTSINKEAIIYDQANSSISDS